MAVATVTNQVTYPFVTRDRQITKISSIDTRFFGNDKPCEIKEATITNLVDNTILFTAYIMANEENESVQHYFANSVEIKPKETIILHSIVGHFLRPGDLLFGSLDFSSYECTAFVSFLQYHNQTYT